jgi:hypothetical protein
MDMPGRLNHHPIEQVIGPVDRFFVDRHEFVGRLLVTGAEKESPDLVGVGAPRSGYGKQPSGDHVASAALSMSQIAETAKPTGDDHGQDYRYHFSPSPAWRRLI